MSRASLSRSRLKLRLLGGSEGEVFCRALAVTNSGIGQHQSHNELTAKDLSKHKSTNWVLVNDHAGQCLGFEVTASRARRAEDTKKSRRGSDAKQA